MDKECKEIFQLVAASGGDPDTVRREDLVRANQGDDHIFEEMDVDDSGDVSLLEWMKFIRASMEEKGSDGEQWLKSWLNRLRANITPSNRGWNSSEGRGAFPAKGSAVLSEYQALQTKLGIHGGPQELEKCIDALLHSKGGIKGFQRALAGIDSDKMERERRALHSKHAADKKALADAHHEIDRLHAHIAETSSESENDYISEREIEELNAVIADLRSELERSQRETARLHPQIEELQKQLERMRQTNDKLGQEVLKDEQKIKKLQKEVVDENAEIKKLKDQIATLQRLPMQLRKYHGH